MYKLLLDTCVWGGSCGTLRAAGYEVTWAGDWTEDPGDAEILRRAAGENRILVTLDKDFGELAIVRGMPHNGIIRLVDIPARSQGAVCAEVLGKYGPEILRGSIATVQENRVRLRLPDSDKDND